MPTAQPAEREARRGEAGRGSCVLHALLTDRTYVAAAAGGEAVAVAVAALNMRANALRHLV